LLYFGFLPSFASEDGDVFLGYVGWLHGLLSVKIELSLPKYCLDSEIKDAVMVWK
jgi:hypothetical protein